MQFLKFQSVLIMEERLPINQNVSNQDNAIEIEDCTFAWDIPDQKMCTKGENGGSKNKGKSKRRQKGRSQTEHLQNGVAGEVEPLASGVENENHENKEPLHAEVLHELNLNIPKVCLNLPRKPLEFHYHACNL